MYIYSVFLGKLPSVPVISVGKLAEKNYVTLYYHLIISFDLNDGETILIATWGGAIKIYIKTLDIFYSSKELSG